MLRIKVELVPFGDENEKRDLGELLIANTLVRGQYDPSTYVYDCHLSPDQYLGVGSRVASVEHRQHEGMWMLVRKALEALDQDDFKAAENKDKATETQKRLMERSFGRTK